MILYSDISCQKEIPNLDLGIVSAGTTKRFEFYAKNNSRAYLRELKFKVDNPEITIISAPESLNSDDMGTLIVEWTPSITLKEGLKTELFIEGKEYWSSL